jgi:hypothetical protein
MLPEALWGFTLNLAKPARELPKAERNALAALTKTLTDSLRKK